MSDNALVAGGAADVATLITQHPTLPLVAAVEVIASTDTAHVAVQLAASTTELDDLVTWADALDVDTVAVTRHERPTAFTNAAVHGTYEGSPVQVWTHPRNLELVALWEQSLHVPDPGVTATFSLRSVRAAAHEVADYESSREATA